MDTELRLAFRPYFEDGTLPVEHTTDTGAPVYHIPETTDELLAWLQFPDEDWLKIDISPKRPIDSNRVYSVTLKPHTPRQFWYGLGVTLPEAILRCWLAWKEAEAE